MASRAGGGVGGIEGGRGGAPVTGDELVLAYWKIYESYMARKERLIEVTTTLYLAGVGALLLQDWTRFWLVHFRAVTLLLLPVVVLGAWFVRQQFRMWSTAARICNSAQSLLADWVSQPSSTKNLTPVALPGTPGVRAPQGLVDEMNRRMSSPVAISPLQAPFETTVYGLGALATIALAAQCVWAWVSRGGEHGMNWWSVVGLVCDFVGVVGVIFAAVLDGERQT